MDISAIERVLDKRSRRGADDKSLIAWLEELKKIHKNNIKALDGFIDAIKQTPLTSLTPTAHVSAELADWLDPKGTLRESGLMKIDKNMPVSKDVRAENALQTAQACPQVNIPIQDDKPLAKHQASADGQEKVLFKLGSCEERTLSL